MEGRNSDGNHAGANTERVSHISDVITARLRWAVVSRHVQPQGGGRLKDHDSLSEVTPLLNLHINPSSMAQSETDITFGNLGRGFQIGINNGSLHLPPERPETPPSPSSTVRFPRDPDYVDRQALLEQVCAKCSIPASRTALVGLGGVGKSQLAIEYSYRVRERSPNTWVFWVHASNKARLELSYREIADYVKIIGREDPKANIFGLVYNWLCDKKNGKWILILDNVDDARFLYEASALSNDGPGGDWAGTLGQPLLAYLPQSTNGSILMTTRTREVALRLVEQRDMIVVEPMDKAHAVTLLEKKLGMQGNGKDIAELAGALECMPLAIVQAAAYISQRAPRASVQQYVEEFRKSDRRKNSLLNHEAGHLRRDREAKNSIITTWQISFEYIRQARSSAADLLSLMSFFDRQGIPVALVRKTETDQNRDVGITNVVDEDTDEDTSAESITDDEFEEDVLILRNYSFISANADRTAFKMHRLVQLATQTWLASHAQLARWRKQFIRNLVAEFPTGEYENWAKCQSLFPHVTLAVSQRPDDVDTLRDWALLIYNAAWYALNTGNLCDAEKMSVHGMKARKKILGQEHPDTLASMNNLATTYSNQGRWKEAEELRIQVMEVTKRVLGTEHPDTLASMGNLATTYQDQGRWVEAEELEVQVLDARKKLLGTEQPHTLISMNNLATTYSNQGRWKEAEKLEVQVLETRRRVLSAEHPDTLASMNNLATTYSRQGRWKEAQELRIQVMEASKRLFAAEQPSTLISMNNLASAYGDQGRWEEAEELQVQALEVSRRVFGAEHPGTLRSMNNLATTYSNQGRWEEAEELQVQLLEASKRVLGAEHPYTLASMGNLATTYQDQGRWVEAEELEVQVLDARKRLLGTEQPHTLISMNNLARTYSNQGRWKEAEKLEVQVLETRRRVLSAEHPDTLASINNLASTYSNQGRLEEAEELEVQVLEVCRRVLGAEHPDTLASMGNLATTYQDQGRWEEAEELQVQVLQVSRRVLGAKHPGTLRSMNNLAFTWKGKGRDAEAVKLIEECVQLRSRVLGVDHPDTHSSSAALRQWKSSKPFQSTELELTNVETILEDVCL